MQHEIEVKYLGVDHDVIRAKLQKLGAELELPLTLMRRTLFDYPDDLLRKRKGRLRVRDEGYRITVTYKEGGSDTYSLESETTVGSYDDMVELFQAIGLKKGPTQETRREIWKLGDVEIMLDEWPWVEPYIEIEGPNEDAIKAVASSLGFDWKDAAYGNSDTAYMHQYPRMKSDETVGAIPELVFDGVKPDWLKERE